MEFGSGRSSYWRERNVYVVGCDFLSLSLFFFFPLKEDDSEWKDGI